MSRVGNVRSNGCRVQLHSGLGCALVGLILGLGFAQAHAQVFEDQKLIPSVRAELSRFGWEVSVSGDRAVVGTRYKDCPAGDDCGAAYVFHFNGARWREEQKLIASDTVRDDGFGESVSISGNIVVVGARKDDCAKEVDCGSAYVFRFDGSSWIEQQKLTAPNPTFLENFGGAVSVSGDTAVVLASGRAYVFRFNGTSWGYEQNLSVIGAGGDHWTSVSVSGDTLVLGIERDDCSAGSDCGSAYVFRFNGTSWIQEQKLMAFDAAAFDQFGGSVSVNGDTVVVGAASTGCPAGDRCGSAYIFRFNGAIWVEEQKLAASEPANELFGRSVSVSGAVAIVGNRGVDSAYVFHFDGTSWVETQELFPSDRGGGFGYSVSVSGGWAMVGSPGNLCTDAPCCLDGYCGAVFATQLQTPAVTPAASTWGLVSATMLLLAGGAFVIRRTASSTVSV